MWVNVELRDIGGTGREMWEIWDTREKYFLWRIASSSSRAVEASTELGMGLNRA